MKRKFKGANAPRAFPYKKELTALKNIKAALQKWVDTMKTYDPEAVVALYTDDASFWGTMASNISTNKKEITAYFVDFLQKDNLEIDIVDEYIEFNEDGQEALYAGAYNFNFTDSKGADHTIPARFTFIFAKQDNGDWLIKHHHSSAMPAPQTRNMRQKPR